MPLLLGQNSGSLAALSSLDPPPARGREPGRDCGRRPHEQIVSVNAEDRREDAEPEISLAGLRHHLEPTAFEVCRDERPGERLVCRQRE
jgi:hypothetical protein